MSPKGDYRVKGLMDCTLENTGTSSSITLSDCILSAADVEILENFNLQSLFKTFTFQLEALRRLRIKGEMKSFL